MNVVTPYKICIPDRGSAHDMHSVKVEAHRHYTTGGEGAAPVGERCFQ